MRCIFLHPSHLESCGHLTLLDRGLVDPFRISSALLVRTRWLAFCLFDLRSERFSHLTHGLCSQCNPRHVLHFSCASCVQRQLGVNCGTTLHCDRDLAGVFWRWKTLVKSSAHIDGGYLGFFASFSCENEALQHPCIRGLGNCYEDICYIYIVYLFDLFVRRHVMSSCIQYQCIPVLVYQCISPCLFGRHIHLYIQHNNLKSHIFSLCSFLLVVCFVFWISRWAEEMEMVQIETL